VTQLFDVRRGAGGLVEVCTAVDWDHGETWEPYVSVYVRSRALDIPGEFVSLRSIADHLREAGWIGPDEERLEERLCLSEPSPATRWRASPPAARLFKGKQCLLRRGHEGYHVNGGFSWEPTQEAEGLASLLRGRGSSL